MRRRSSSAVREFSASERTGRPSPAATMVRAMRLEKRSLLAGRKRRLRILRWSVKLTCAVMSLTPGSSSTSSALPMCRGIPSAFLNREPHIFDSARVSCSPYRQRVAGFERRARCALHPATIWPIFSSGLFSRWEQSGAGIDYASSRTAPPSAIGPARLRNSHALIAGRRRPDTQRHLHRVR